MNFKLGQYLPGSSFIHLLDPRVKIMAVVAVSIAIFRADLLIAAAITVFVAAIVLAARLSAAFLLRALKPPALFFALIFLLHLLFTEGTPVSVLPFVTYEGLNQGALLTWRFIFLILNAAILTATTQSSELIGGMEWFLRPFKLWRSSSHDLAVMVAMVLRFLPALLLELEQIKEAQMARGANFKTGNIRVKMIRIISLAIPLVRNSILRADEVALAMEARSFCPGEPRTYSREPCLALPDYLALAVLIILAALWAFYLW